MTYPSYRYDVDALFTGSSLGNYVTFVRLSRETDVKGLWSAIDNKFYVGDWRVELELDGEASQPAETIFKPESQTTVYRRGKIALEKQFFVPFGRDERSIAQPSLLQSCVFLIRG